MITCLDPFAAGCVFAGPSLQLLTGGPSPSSLQTPAHGSHIPDMRGAGAAHVGAATLERPRGICVDEWGGLWVADVKASAVSLVDAKTGVCACEGRPGLHVVRTTTHNLSQHMPQTNV